MIKSCTSILFIILLVKSIALSQSNAIQESNIYYKNEHSLGIQLYSYGYGLSYKFAKRIDYLNKRNFEIEINTIKHPKEEKIRNTTYGGGDKFILGKINETINTRWGYGKQKEIYSRKHDGSINIRFHYLYGLDLTIQKPIYYEVIESSPDGFGVIYKKYNDSEHTSENIYGKAPFSEGLNELKLIPGGFGKLSFSFEFMTKKRVTHNLEGGIVCDVYPWEVEIMAHTNNQHLFYSLFFSYRIGLIVDAKNKAKRKKKLEQ